MGHNRSSGLYLLVLLISVFSTPVTYSANWNPLADTGLDFCFDAEDLQLDPCPGVIDPFYGQDGNYLGKPLSLKNNGDGTISDLNSELMWSDATSRSQDWNLALSYCVELSYAGYTDWRLPEIFELQSLVNYSRFDPAFDPVILTESPDRSAGLWSATPSAADPTETWFLSIKSGGLFQQEKSQTVRYGTAMCVRGEKQNPGAYVDNGDTITDILTFVTWQKSVDVQTRTWEQALSYCSHLTLDGENDWRLPNIRELGSVIDFSSYDPALNTGYFPASMPSEYFWSSTTSSLEQGYDGAWAGSLTNGNTITGRPKDAMSATRCIRGGLVEYFGLSVLLAGTGSGDVQGETVPAGKAIIDCGTGCSDDLPDGKVVRLTATPEPGSSFVRWGGDFVGGEDCEGDSGVCSLQMLEDTVVVAYFMPNMQLTVTKDGLGAGLVTSSPVGILCGDGTPGDCDQHYVFSTEVTLTAVPVSGSSFWYWSGEDCSGNGECTVSMDRARSVTATFRPNLIALYLLEATKSGDGAGNITSIPEGIDCGDGDCAKSFPVGSEVTLTASSEPGSVFSGWNGFPCFGTSPTCVVTMSTAWTQDAEFTADTTTPRQLTVTIQDDALGHSGRVTSSPRGINCGTDCTELYPYKERVTLFATPDSDASFVGWSGACIGIDPCLVSMTVPRQVTANFGPAPFSKLLTVTKDGNGLGTVTSSLIEGIDCGTDCSEIYPQNSEITLIATPAVGRNFLGWSGGGCSGTGDCQITLLSNTTVNATFEMDPAMEAVYKDGFEAE